MSIDHWHRAAEIFESALDLPAGDRPQFVEAACADDVALLDEVRALLDASNRQVALDVPLGPDVVRDLCHLGRIGPYVVQEILGIGGMGEVYRARDPRLGRDVAIKVLPTGTADAGRLARFTREAQALAALNHPHIASIYGFETDGASRAIVLELVEGQTVADRLAHGPLSLDETLSIAAQVADALAAAHDAGIVHRDVKPANVKVRTDGTAKVLDFGIAKIAGSDTAAAPPGHLGASAPAHGMTNAGAILGTAGYLSPEQARGRPVDRRTDVWAFGCLLYEMLTGRRAFDGIEVSDTLTAVVEQEPDWSALGHVPPSIRRVVHRCLEKNPDRRYHALTDAKLDLAEGGSAATEMPPRPAWPERALWVALAATLVGGLVALARRPTPPEGSEVRFQLAAPEQGFFGSFGGGGIAAGLTGGATMSPDGTRIAFVATDAARRTSLWLRPLDAPAARPLTGTEDASQPFWSPSGTALGFFANGALKVLDIAKGTVRVLAHDTGLGRGASWGRENIIVFISGNPAQLSYVSAAGGPVNRVAGQLGNAMGWPQFLPDGRHFIYFTLRRPDGTKGIALASVDPGSTVQSLVHSDTGASVLPSGHLLFSRDKRFWLQPFDAMRLRVTGQPTPVDEPILVVAEIGFAAASVSPTGALLYQSEAIPSGQFTWVDRTGQLLETAGPPGRYRAFALSPDRTRLAYEDLARDDIWLLDLARGTTSRFTSGPGTEMSPVWSPDGQRIAYRRTSTGQVVDKAVDGTAAEHLLLEGYMNGPTQVSPDGKWLLYFFAPPDASSQDVFVLPMTGGGVPTPVVQSPFADVEPQFSPDGRWLAYASNETGRNEVYVQPFPPTGPRWQLSQAGGRQPQWRADGQELYFVADDRRFYAVDVRANERTFDYGVPRFLFTMQANVTNVRNSYVPSADGKRFLVNLLLETSRDPLHVILNWRPR